MWDLYACFNDKFAAMKILVVIPTLGIGGAERLLSTLLPVIANMDMDIRVCILSKPMDLAAEIESYGIPVINLNLSHRWSFFEAIYKVAKQFKKYRPDYIWCHLYFGILYSRLARLFFSEMKVVSLLHYSVSKDSNSKNIWYTIRDKMFGSSHKIDFKTVAVSESVKKDFEEYYGWGNIEVIYNAIDVEKIDNCSCKESDYTLKKCSGISSDDYKVVVPGNLNDSKGHFYLIEAIDILRYKYHCSPKIFIVGEGPNRPKIERQIIEHGLENQIYLLGSLKQIDLFSLMGDCDLVVIPSLYEAFGLAALEAMCLEKPLVVSAIDGLKEITTNDWDVLQVPAGNAEAIAEGMDRIINDIDFSMFLATNARNTALKYDVSIISNQWVRVFSGYSK